MKTDGWAEAVDRLLGGIAHEANGRATALRGVSILASEESPETWRGLLEYEAERMERLAAGLSALRLEAPEPLDAAAAAEAAVPTLSAMHVDLQVAVGESDEPLAVKEARGQLVRTLIVLALELVPPRTAESVSCRVVRRAGQVEIELRSPKATSPPELTVPLEGARLERLPDGYRLSLAALGAA